MRCNEHIKFEALLDRATALGFDAVATGHYARVVEHDGRRELHRSPNMEKDQSYVLAVMGPDRLARAMFPLGGYESKAEVRAEAERRGLSVSAKPDSYDICFVADGDTRGFLQSRLGSRPGEIVDTDGRVLGGHDGAYAFTVGQRKGLRIDRPADDGRPRYVLDVQPTQNRVVVGPAELLTVDTITGTGTVWFDGADTSGAWFDAEVQVRAHGTPVPARVRATASGVEVRLTGERLRGVAPGQSVVLYDGTRVVGQATVSEASRSGAARTAAVLA